jgi:hypothetical protein
MVQSTAAVLKCVIFTDMVDLSLAELICVTVVGCNIKTFALSRARNCCRTMFHAECVGGFMIYHCARFHMPVLTSSLVIPSKAKRKKFYRAVAMLFVTFFRKLLLEKLNVSTNLIILRICRIS